MNLSIVSPEKILRYEVAWVELNTVTGNVIIHRGHAPTVFILEPQQPALFKLKTGKEEHIVIDNGIAEITRESITILIH